MNKLLKFKLVFLIVMLCFNISFSQEGWVSQVSGTSAPLFSVSFPDENNGTAVGEGGVILRTTNGGTDWISQTSGTTDYLMSVSFSDADNGTAVGTDESFASGTIYRTTDGGENWVSQASGTINYLNGVYSVDAATVTAVGYEGTILRTTDGGENWVIQPVGTTNELTAVFFADANIGWVVGPSGSIYNTTDGGENWVSQASGVIFNLQAVSFVDVNTGWIVGQNGTILKTTNGGENWINQTGDIHTWLYGVSFTDTDNGTAVGSSGLIIRTTNGGDTWTSEASGITTQLNGVSFLNANTGTAVGYNGTVLRRSGGGSAPSAPSNLLAVADTFFVDLSWDDNSDNELGFKIERKDDSLHISSPWVLIDSVGTDITAYVDSGLIPFTTYSYRIYSYNEFGTSSADSVETTTILPVELNSFTATVNGSTVNLNWSTASETNNRGFEVYRKNSEDRSQETEWSLSGYVEGNGTTTETKSYSFSDNNLSAGNYIYRLKQIDYDGSFEYSNEIETEISTPNLFALHQNYPNPFNPVTVISYQLQVSSVVTLKVYDALGQEVKALVKGTIEAGIHNIEFDASGLNSGVYFYTIEANGINGNNFTSTKKMLVIK